MNPGGRTALLLSSLALVGCADASNGLKVKTVGNAAETLSRSSDEIGFARAQLALGNVGLALEAFRKARRDKPSDVAPLAGIGDCYAAMGRFDIAQSSYESALALSPHNRSLLLALAAIFDQEGKPALAMAARAESQIIETPAPLPLLQAATKPALAPAPDAQPSHKAVASVGSITVDLPRALPVANMDAATVASGALPRRQQVAGAVPIAAPQIGAPVALSSSITVPLPAPRTVTTELSTAHDPRLASANAPEATIGDAALAPVIKPAPSRASSLGAATEAMLAPTDQRPLRVLPPPRLVVQEMLAMINEPVGLEPAPVRPAPEPAPDRAPSAQAVLGPASAPRLERLSLGEVALITTAKPIWRAPENSRTAAAAVRWAALDRPPTPNIQLFNAARSQGLAASARTILSGRGWRRIAIGDAPAVQRKSVVLYPESQASLGRRLAAQFGVEGRVAKRDNIILLLGRDLVNRIGGQQSS